MDVMTDSSRLTADEAALRLARLEARVAALERELDLLRSGASLADADASRRAMADTQPMFALAPVAGLPQGRGGTGGFDITSEFDAIDVRLEEQAGREALVGRSTSLADIKIDSTLIDKAFERPPPEKIVVVSDLEVLHPRIMERVLGTWRTAELLDYLKKLIVDERGDRAGFSMNVMSDLLLLAAVLETPPDRVPWNPDRKTI